VSVDPSLTARSLVKRFRGCAGDGECGRDCQVISKTRRLPEARWQRRVVVRSSRLLRFWLKVSNTNSEIGTTCLARARACGASAAGGS
jgi:hypothetical protein